MKEIRNIKWKMTFNKEETWNIEKNCEEKRSFSQYEMFIKFRLRFGLNSIEYIFKQGIKIIEKVSVFSVLFFAFCILFRNEYKTLMK